MWTEAACAPAYAVVAFLDPQQLVVLGHSVGTRRSPGLDLAAVGCHSEVGDRRVLSLAGTVAHHATEAGPVGKINSVQGLGQRSDLVDLDQQGTGCFLGDAALQPRDVRHE